MEIECPLCKYTKWISLDYEHCEIGFPDGSPYLGHVNLVVCKGCGLVRVDSYKCKERIEYED